MKWYVWLVLILVCLATIMHYTIEPKGPPKDAPVSYESDAELCAQAATGTPVINATPSQIVSYCLAHG